MAVLVVVQPVTAVTWNVPSNVPTIPLAMDSAGVGDTILVAPGTYYLQQLPVTNGVVLTSSGGPLQTTITTDWMPPTFGALYCIGLTEYTEISGFHLLGYSEGLIFDGCSTIWVSHCAEVCVKNNIIETSFWGLLVDETTVGFDKVTVTNNTFYDWPLNHPPYYSGRNALEIRDPIMAVRVVEVRHNIVWEKAAFGISLLIGTISCNDFRFAENIPAWATGNISADPLFCTEMTGTSQFGIMDLSPCAPANSGDCGLIGAAPVLCRAVPADETSWGAVKDKFRR